MVEQNNSQTRSQSNTEPAFLQVIRECIKQDPECTFPGATLDRVLQERFPLGKGGVSHAHRKLHAEIRQDIAAYYDHAERAGREARSESRYSEFAP